MAETDFGAAVAPELVAKKNRKLWAKVKTKMNT
jgi:hypothetical protein